MTYLFIDSVIKSRDSPDWLVHTCYQSASSRVTETKFLIQKCFSVENLIIVSLNTVVPFLVYCRELAPGTVSLTGDRAQGDDSKYDSHYNTNHCYCLATKGYWMSP